MEGEGVGEVAEVQGRVVRQTLPYLPWGRKVELNGRYQCYTIAMEQREVGRVAAGTVSTRFNDTARMRANGVAGRKEASIISRFCC